MKKKKSIGKGGKTNNFLLNNFLVSNTRKENDQSIRKSSEERNDKSTNDTRMKNFKKKIRTISNRFGTEGNDDTKDNNKESIPCPCITTWHKIIQTFRIKNRF